MSSFATERLRAEDVEDLAVIAALLHDSHTCIGEMLFNSAERVFICVLKRIVRDLDDQDVSQKRVETALVFNCVDNVQYRDIDPAKMDAVLTLLTIATEPGVHRLYHINLLFEDGAQLKLESDCVDCRLEDFGHTQSQMDLPAKTPPQ